MIILFEMWDLTTALDQYYNRLATSNLPFCNQLTADKNTPNNTTTNASNFLQKQQSTLLQVFHSLSLLNRILFKFIWHLKEKNVI